ncbi:MAG: DUF402 domain-containing protein [Gemmatimonas sp.]|nr:DUF402 domain-containing protein [Gemmatimonas sp.]
MNLRSVSIHYHRLPARTQVFNQLVLEEQPDVTVTFLPSADLDEAVSARKAVLLEPGAPIVWFTYPGRWYDIGRFHLADGTFTGFYANILTPVKMDRDRWDTTDLFLDVWIGADGTIQLLDESELQHAVDAAWIDAGTAATARQQADTLTRHARQGLWPPEHVRDWTLERARRRLDDLRRRQSM